MPSPVQSHSTTNNGAVNSVSPSIRAQYSRMLLERVAVMEDYDRYAQAKTIEQNGNTKKLEMRRYKTMLPATTPLEEYDGANIKAPNKIAFTTEEIELKHYGDYVIVTDENELYNLDKVKTEYMGVISDQAALTKNRITRAAVLSGTNVQYADDATSRDTIGTKKLTKANLYTVVNKLQNQGAKKHTSVIGGTTKVGTTPIDAAYIAIVHHSMRYQLLEIDGFIRAELYENRMPNEFGSFDRVRFIEDVDGPETVDSAGRKILQGIVFGKDAYATLTLRGSKNIEMIVKSKQEVGGPLNQFSTIGWKLITGAGIINEAWLVRLETSADIYDTSAKHYYDL